MMRVNIFMSWNNARNMIGSQKLILWTNLNPIKYGGIQNGLQ